MGQQSQSISKVITLSFPPGSMGVRWEIRDILVADITRDIHDRWNNDELFLGICNVNNGYIHCFDINLLREKNIFEKDGRLGEFTKHSLSIRREYRKFYSSYSLLLHTTTPDILNIVTSL